MVRNRLLLLSGCVLGCSATAFAQVWESAPALPDNTQGRLWAAGLNEAGTLFAIGGSPFDLAGDAVVHYLPSGAMSWSAGRSVEGPVVRQGAGLDNLGRIIVFGGVDGTDPEGDPGTTYVYDIVEGQWQGLADRSGLAPPDYFAFATDDAGRIYSIGGGPGAAADATQPNSAHVERYVAATDLWEPVAPMPTAIADGTAAYDGRGHILVIGGYDQHATARLASVLQYDIASDTWSAGAIPDMPVALTGARAVHGADDRIYVLGGEAGSIGAGTTQTSVYALHLDTLTWSSRADMPTPRRNFAVTLGDDDYIYAIGGMNDAGGTHRVDKLHTPPCPSITDAPASLTTWSGTIAGFSVAATGAVPFSHQWRKDGADLVDGLTGTGSTISGATASLLTVDSPDENDAGTYDVVVSNACGATASPGATLTIQSPPDIPTQWQVFNIHPGWAQSSSVARGIGNGRIGGGATTPTLMPDGRTFTLEHPVVWDDQSFVDTDVTPAGSVGGAINDVEGELLAGWFWHTWNCPGGGQTWTCAWKSAAFWTAPTMVFAEAVHSSGFDFDHITGTDGLHMAGTLVWEDQHEIHFPRAHMWSAANQGNTLHNSTWTRSSAMAIDGNRQYGYYYVGTSSWHAVLWEGTVATAVDLHPAGYWTSLIYGAGDGQAVGTADSNAGLWVQTAAAFIDLNPAGATSSTALAAHQGLQSGSASNRAALWAGTAGSYFDLGSTVPPEYSTSNAEDFEIAPDGTITVVGSGYNTVTARNEALVWRSFASTTTAGDVNCDTVLDFGDVQALVEILLGADTDPCHMNAADMNSDGAADGLDIQLFVTAILAP